jgi:hypothetical protein
MRNLKTFENFEPIDSEVSEIMDILANLYEVKLYDVLGKKVKGVMIDDKINYIDGTFSSKKVAVNRMYLEVIDSLSGYKESSIRKAIKNFLSK